MGLVNLSHRRGFRKRFTSDTLVCLEAAMSGVTNADRRGFLRQVAAGGLGERQEKAYP
jgi:hypothetical protein